MIAPCPYTLPSLYLSPQQAYLQFDFGLVNLLIHRVVNDPRKPWRILKTMGKKFLWKSHWNPLEIALNHGKISKNPFEKKKKKKKLKIEFNLPIIFSLQRGLVFEFLKFLELYFLYTWNILKDSIWSCIYLNFSWMLNNFRNKCCAFSQKFVRKNTLRLFWFWLSDSSCSYWLREYEGNKSPINSSYFYKACGLLTIFVDHYPLWTTNPIFWILQIICR